MASDYEALVERYCQGKTAVLGETPVPVPLCTPQHYLYRRQ